MNSLLLNLTPQRQEARRRLISEVETACIRLGRTLRPSADRRLAHDEGLAEYLQLALMGRETLVRILEAILNELAYGADEETGSVPRVAAQTAWTRWKRPAKARKSRR